MITITEAITQGYTIIHTGRNEDLSYINMIGLCLLPGDFIKIETHKGLKILKIGMFIRFHLIDRQKIKRYSSGDYGTVVAIDTKIHIRLTCGTIITKDIHLYDNIERKDLMPAYAISNVCLKHGNSLTKYGIIGSLDITTEINGVTTCPEKNYLEFMVGKTTVEVTYTSIYDAMEKINTQKENIAKMILETIDELENQIL